MKEFQQVIGDGWKSFKCCLKGFKKKNDGDSRKTYSLFNESIFLVFSQSSCPLGTNVNLARQAANELVAKAFSLLILSRYPIETAKSCFVPPFSFSIISVNPVIFLLNYFIFFSRRYPAVFVIGPLVSLAGMFIYIYTHIHTQGSF